MSPRNWRKVAFFLACLLTPLAACSKDDDGKTGVIGLVVPSADNPYFVEMIAGAKKAAAAPPAIELLVQAPERGATDPERQLQIVESLIARKASALLVVPADSTQVVTAIVDANKAHVPFIDLDNDIDHNLAIARGATVTSYIGSNNRAGGRLAGEYVKTQFGANGGQVAVLEGVPGVEAAIDRKAGFMNALANDPKIVVVSSQVADWDREKAYNITKGVIAANPRLAAIFGSNDEMALGASKAVAETGKNIIVIGYDATPDGRAAVAAGRMSATVAQDPAEVGRLGVEYARRILAGEKIPDHTEVPLKVISGKAAGK